MSWIEVKAVFGSPPPDWSLIVDVFGRYGCENTLEEDNPPAISSAVVDVANSERVVRELSADLMAAGALRVDTRSLVEQNWEESWKKFFHPRDVGSRFLVRPTWEEALSQDRLTIVLDPGQAFGTGDHPTTRMCLELLERVRVNGTNVADVGCGSGILSIGACLLGARSVVSVDIEPLSVEVARQNASLNGVPFEAFVGRGLEPVADKGPFDLVLSNIISAALIQLASGVFDSLVPGGNWIVSGIIEQNWPDVVDAAEAAGFELADSRMEDGWVGATFARPV